MKHNCIAKNTIPKICYTKGLDIMRKSWKPSEVRLLRDYYDPNAIYRISPILAHSPKFICKRTAPVSLRHRSKNSHDTLCWSCQKALGQCSWSSNLTPVNHWCAIPTFIANDNESSFFVIRCPEFVSDVSGKG